MAGEEEWRSLGLAKALSYFDYSRNEGMKKVGNGKDFVT
jgi:hypothetical protein